MKERMCKIFKKQNKLIREERIYKLFKNKKNRIIIKKLNKLIIEEKIYNLIKKEIYKIKEIKTIIKKVRVEIERSDL